MTREATPFPANENRKTVVALVGLTKSAYVKLYPIDPAHSFAISSRSGKMKAMAKFPPAWFVCSLAD